MQALKFGGDGLLIQQEVVGCSCEAFHAFAFDIIDLHPVLTLPYIHYERRESIS